MTEHRVTPSFAFDRCGLWDVHGDFAVPLDRLAEANDGIACWAVRAATETSAGIVEIERTFRRVIDARQLYSGRIDWPSTLRSMRSERNKVLLKLGRECHRQLTNTNPVAVT